ncbi:uncharacterized protein B0T15DRAFT_534840 [Chaetomium strumarium]|uniref:DUF7730 domain-containing protein n=1 Tax=Chaetomium strumarium TaxID=1170767 RepID=A0AAJ0GU97_9PEZI|nr:hypothetical protein B0T15DRAFT_534840 [Chaetomium strumarium]
MSANNQGSISRGFRQLLCLIRPIETSNINTDTNEGDEYPLPFLPAQRPRPLTPISSQQSPINLGRLARVPPELRWRILIAAFGGRTLHLDMQFAHPRRADAFDLVAQDVNGAAHGFGVSPLSPWYFPARDAPRAWRWTSCVCHRMLPVGSRFERRCLAKGRPVASYPHSDGCLYGEVTYCHLWPPETITTRAMIGAPGKCMVGVMGWLLACRQAYVEGVNVLYSTNTFFIESDILFSNLVCRESGLVSRHLILPERLTCITSLELRLDLVLFGSSLRPDRGKTHDSNKDRAQLAANLRHLCDPFPNLRSLVLSFRDHLYNDREVRPVYALDEINRVLLRPLAHAMTRLPLPARQKGIVVELPSNVFEELKGVRRKGGAPGLGLEEEEKVCEIGNGGFMTQSVWLRYPLSCGAAVSDPAAECGHDRSDFYYIKKGPESDLFWDHNGTPQCRPYLTSGCSG